MTDYLQDLETSKNRSKAAALITVLSALFLFTIIIIQFYYFFCFKIRLSTFLDPEDYLLLGLDLCLGLIIYLLEKKK